METSTMTTITGQQTKFDNKIAVNTTTMTASTTTASPPPQPTTPTPPTTTTQHLRHHQQQLKMLTILTSTIPTTGRKQCYKGKRSKVIPHLIFPYE
eukprot:scaffold377696_cov18-Prasinocladus_malaysianus.AAC.1